MDWDGFVWDINELPATVNNDRTKNENHKTNISNDLNSIGSWTFVSWLVLQTFSDL
jgi:hypothetical protein